MFGIIQRNRTLKNKEFGGANQNGKTIQFLHKPKTGFRVY